MAQYINEAKRWQKLANILTEAVEVPSWLAGKLEDVHTKPGQGSIFAKSIADVLKLAQDALDKEQNIDKIANSTGTLTIKSPGIGYNLVLPIDKAKALPGAKESEVEKIEGPNKVKVPAITTSAPLTQFKTDELTVIVRPKKDESGAVIPNEYIVLSAFPGDPSIPRASEWNGKYAVIIPGGKEEMNENIDTSNWGKETDEYGDSEENFRFKPDLADFDYDEEAYKEYMATHFPNEKIGLQELQYFHNGAEVNQTINYDDSDITDDLEAFGQGSMDGQDFKPGETYNIGGQEYKVEPQGDEFKLVLAESFDQLDEIVDRVLAKMRKKLNENISSQEFEETIDELTYELVQDEYMGDTPTDLQSVADIISARAEDKLNQKVEFQLVQGDKIKYDIPGTDPYIQYTYSF